MKRDDFLNHIRQSFQQATLPDALSDLLPDRPLSPFNSEDLQESFIQEAIILKAQIHQVDSEEQAYEAIIHLFDRYDATNYLSWDHLPLTQLEEQLAARGIIREDSQIPLPVNERQARLGELANVPIGITGAMAGLADNGGLVMQHGMGNGRLASLIVPIHIAILRGEDLFPSMAHFLQAHPQAAQSSSNLVLICGPSRTADIEQTLTIGVHGPKELHVILMY